MNKRQILVLSVIFIGFGFAFGHSVGTEQIQKKYDKLKENYDTLETQYKRDLESCYIQLGD